jgi:hypothetical protein
MHIHIDIRVSYIRYTSYNRLPQLIVKLVFFEGYDRNYHMSKLICF